MAGCGREREREREREVGEGEREINYIPGVRVLRVLVLQDNVVHLSFVR